MAEISYPFNADNEAGGTSIVSQTQWQAMAAGWAGDYIDYRLTTPGESLPFNASVINGRDVQIGAGRAWVGGFYYQLTDTTTLTVPANATSRARKDMIVLRADLAKSAVNLALRVGTAAASPVEPSPTRSRGGVWEMALYVVDVPANNGAIVLARRAPFSMAPMVAFPWNAQESVLLMPKPTLAIDADQNSSGGQEEVFRGNDGYVRTRTLGKTNTYTPGLVNAGALAASSRTGRWRWIAPNVCWFQITISNSTAKPVNVAGNQWRVGVTLPQTSNPRGIQTFQGYLSNPNGSSGLPNMLAVTATTHPKSQTLYLHSPSSATTKEGLDGLRIFPAKSTFSISGVLEANEFNE
ncbi:hypothetical protein AB0J38_41160 [Streptomyces sp. NPDC050095]|uniref:hypothetical protein n=1 Tax=unclassified Streptomyces TaxID=2593676 RepID=UPI003432DF0D